MPPRRRRRSHLAAMPPRRRRRSHLAARLRPGAWVAVDFCGERMRLCVVAMLTMIECRPPVFAPRERTVLVLLGRGDAWGSEMQCHPEFLLDPARRPVFLGYGRPRPRWLLRLPVIGRRLHPFSRP